MIKLNKKIEYSLIILKSLAQKPSGEKTSARGFCEEFNIPFDTTSKIMQTLNNVNIVGSAKGPKGGYYLIKPLSELSLTDLFSILNEKFLSLECIEDQCQIASSCNISKPVRALSFFIENYFKELSLEEILQFEVPQDYIGQITNLNNIAEDAT